MAQIQADLKNTLLAAVEGVDGDELLELAREGEPNDETGFSDDPRFIAQLDWLDSVHHIEPRAWPYVYIPGEEEGQVYFVVDLWARYDPLYDTSKAAGFMEAYTSKGSMLQGLDELTYRTTDGQFTTYTDEWGSWVSAYAPITNSQGERIGGMGIDFQANYVDSVRQAILDRIALAFGVTYVALFVLVYIASELFNRPILRLTNAAEQIGEGDYDQDMASLITGRFRDEISTLSQVFSIMVGKVREREQKLMRQVEELKIEIDTTKQRSQVIEIVESDFFKDLQAKAGKMRRDRRRGQRKKD
jgi:methyl-accepting chemotaxis protein